MTIEDEKRKTQENLNLRNSLFSSSQLVSLCPSPSTEESRQHTFDKMGQQWINHFKAMPDKYDAWHSSIINRYGPTTAVIYYLTHMNVQDILL